MGQNVSQVRRRLQGEPLPREEATDRSLPDPVTLLETNKAPLFIEDYDAPNADWNRETLYTYAKRLCGALPESETERRKRAQRHASFVPGIHSDIHFSHQHQQSVPVLVADAAVRRLQIFMRRANYRRRWRAIVDTLVHRLREQAQLERACAEEAVMLGKFRDILLGGFSAAKVSARGNLKNITMRLVVDADACYLTWTPSVKKTPRLYIRAENIHVPSRLLRHISYRRSLVIYGTLPHLTALPLRTILQVGSSKERDLLVRGFSQFLSDSVFQTFMDDAGVLRKDKRRAPITYFNPTPVETTDHLTALERLERAEIRQRRGRVSCFATHEPQEEYGDEDDIDSNTVHQSDFVLSDDDEQPEPDRSRSDHSDDGLPVHPHPTPTKNASADLEEKAPPPLLQYYATRYDEMEVAPGVVDHRPRPVHQQAHLEKEEASLAYLFESLLSQ
ncbi:hypothetical protein SPRG_00662 [Saprolegnia parasitica CBS 223.65]|uniref:Uncharacterized protein n=1 Tax=Saprolegnia parasitica (strain CBS 223.65) TaxID=695850 RepID=A0A067CV67_SAPPC|nr:hypothetical protein SPRG_00662 [Saprolegnia parasitica CBS 223.65]KDO34599.1 hypothetical protein SPRG_00662 [Saprolegnia parasitica CBS 223.65]|eukprot:XP_012194276.1 hypothetical protein SPRG_00662 [Saprolegnia parasitica CBS 223.65]